MAKPKPTGQNITTERIAELMREQGLKQVDLADAVGVRPLAVGRWLRGENAISPFNLERVANALNTTVRYLRGLPGAYKSKDDLKRAELQAEALFSELDDGAPCFEGADGQTKEEVEAIIEQRQKEDAQRRTVRNGFFLNEMGYAYRERSDTEFSGVFCALKDAQGQEYDFSEEEFQRFMAQIKEFVDFACFKNRSTAHETSSGISSDRMDKFTSDAQDFVIIKPAPKRRKKATPKGAEDQQKPAVQKEQV